MPLPDLIEIIPPTGPIHAAITVPGSKSITNRALILAALADGATTLRGALWSEDTQVMADCLGHLGCAVRVEPDPAEDANRTITVRGAGGLIPRAGTADAPLELFVGNAGTAARFLAALLCLGRGAYRLSGVPRMHERPQAALFHALRALGYRMDAPNDRLPAVIHGTGPRPGRCTVSVAESSQFASALLLSGGVAGWSVDIAQDGDAEELPYVEMTRELVKVFPERGGEFQVEPDASSGSYFIAAGHLLGGISVPHWPATGWQIDGEFPRFLPLPAEVSRARDLGDSIMTAIVLAALAGRPVRFTDLGRLRVQECERVVALRTELTKCGALVIEEGDTLTVHPSRLHGAEIETYNDHRMAMCFAVLGLKVPGIRLRNPSCVKKTFPNFFQKLAASQPHGLGVEIREAAGRRLARDELAAE
ncbi:MAG: 3-phosphoshikimate 1-carboxyvinyltransferase [Limisphaerales bacterium]